jgi:alpha-1,2-mannosyltransferase
MTPSAPNARPLQNRLWKGGFGLLLFLLILAGAGVAAPDRRAPWRVLGRDFFVAYCAGTLAREGRWAELHDAPAFMRFQDRMEPAVGLEPSDKRGPWLNPPFYALVWMPLSALPYPLAWCVWTGVSLLSLAAAAWLLARWLAPSPAPGSRGLVPLLLCCSMPAIQTLCAGQSAAVALLILVVVATCWRQRRGLTAGLAAGLLAYKPQLGAVVAAALVFTLGWRALAGLVLSGGPLLFATWLFLPSEALGAYAVALPKTMQFMQETGRFVWNRHATFRAFGHLLLHGRAGAEGWAVSALTFAGQSAVGAALAAAFWRARSSFAGAGDGAAVTRDRLIAATVAAMALLMPYYVDYDLLLLAVPATLLGREWLNHRTDQVSAADRWLLRAWIALYLWLFINPGTAQDTRVNLTVPLLTAVAGVTIARAWRSQLAPRGELNEPTAVSGPPLPLAA